MIFFNLEIITSCHYNQHIMLHKYLAFLAVTNLKHKNYPSFYKFLLLLSGDYNTGIFFNYMKLY